jgi:antitoxin MazE
MIAQVNKWGNSLAVRIPAVFAKELNLEDGANIELSRVEEGIILRPRKNAFSLKELLTLVRPENLHGETDWGPRVGRETW